MTHPPSGPETPTPPPGPKTPTLGTSPTLPKPEVPTPPGTPPNPGGSQHVRLADGKPEGPTIPVPAPGPAPVPSVGDVVWTSVAA